jgi:hypothetical protein
MEPYSEAEIRKITEKNPGATRGMIEEYQTLLAEKFAIGPKSRLTNRAQIRRANEIRQKIDELYRQIFLT